MSEEVPTVITTISKGIVYSYYEEFFEQLENPAISRYHDFTQDEYEKMNILPFYKEEYMSDMHVFLTFFNCYKFFTKKDVIERINKLSPQGMINFKDAVKKIKNEGPVEYRMKKNIGTTRDEIIKSFEDNVSIRKTILRDIKSREFDIIQSIFDSHTDTETLYDSFDQLENLYRGRDLIESLTPKGSILLPEHYVLIKNNLPKIILNDSPIPIQSEKHGYFGKIFTGIQTSLTGLSDFFSKPLKTPQIPNQLHSFPAITLGNYDETFLIKT